MLAVVQEAIPSNVGLRGVHLSIMPPLDPDPAYFNIEQVETCRYCLQPHFSLSWADWILTKDEYLWSSKGKY